MTEELDLIAARRGEIERLRADHHSALKTLDAESAELDVAERVLRRLGGLGAAIHYEPKGGTRPHVSTGKPPNTPTVPEMILELLAGRAQYELGGLDSKGLTELIGEKWWPGVTKTEVNPIAWRMAKRGQLIKDGIHYRLPRNALMDPPPPEGDDPPDDV